MIMKIKRIIILFLGLIIPTLACKKNLISELDTINISNKTDDPLLLSEMAREEVKIQLETKDKVFLGYIFEVKLHRSRVFISDIKSISIFDLEGNFIQQLGRQGEGPGEYKSVTSMDIDEASGLIYVSAYNKLLIFAPDYKLIEERKLGFPIGYLKILDGSLWIVSEEIGMEIGDEIANQANIYKLNQDLEITDTIPYKTVILDQIRVGGYGFRYWLSDIEEGLFMYMPVLTPENIVRDTLYQVKEEDKIVKPAVRFQFERPQSFDKWGVQTLALLNIFNSSSYYILEYDQDYKRFMFLYDKKNKTGFNLSGGLIDDEGDPVFLRPLDLKKDLFYYIKKAEFEDKSIEEKNPVIGIVKLK